MVHLIHPECGPRDTLLPELAAQSLPGRWGHPWAPVPTSGGTPRLCRARCALMYSHSPTRWVCEEVTGRWSQSHAAPAPARSCSAPSPHRLWVTVVVLGEGGLLGVPFESKGLQAAISLPPGRLPGEWQAAREPGGAGQRVGCPGLPPVPRMCSPAAACPRGSAVLPLPPSSARPHASLLPKPARPLVT